MALKCDRRWLLFLGVHMRLSSRCNIWFTLGLFANYLSPKSHEWALKSTELWNTSLFFYLNYDFIDESFAFSPGEIYILNINIVKQHTALSIITFHGLPRGLATVIYYRYKLFHICCDMDPAWSAQLLCHRQLHVAYRLLQRWHHTFLGKNVLVRDNHSVHKVNIWCICICMVYMTAQEYEK